MMYENYWGLQRSIFGSLAGREALVQSPVHAEALARVEFLRDNRLSLGLLVGPAGSGKTTVLAEAAQQARRGGALAALVNCGGDDFFVLARIATGLYAETGADGFQLWRHIVTRLEELRLEGMSAVLLVDDIDRASTSVVSHIEQLLSVPDSPLTIVISARPEAVKRISSRLLDRAALRIDLSPWTEGETCAYLDTTVTKAGRVQPVFDHAAVRRLFELSGGAPRRVNQLAQLALVAGAAQKLVQVDVATIDAVEEELSLAR
jgi:general secretion pathway protein A